jgi:hypothetical protein
MRTMRPAVIDPAIDCRTLCWSEAQKQPPSRLSHAAGLDRWSKCSCVLPSNRRKHGPLFSISDPSGHARGRRSCQSRESVTSARRNTRRRLVAQSMSASAGSFPRTRRRNRHRDTPTLHVDFRAAKSRVGQQIQSIRGGGRLETEHLCIQPLGDRIAFISPSRIRRSTAEGPRPWPLRGRQA